MELKTPLPQHPMQELVAEVAKIEIPAPLASAMTKMELKTPKTTSSEPSSQWRMSTRKTKKEPTPELESEEEEVKSLDKVESSGEDLESKEEAEPATLPPEKKKMETQAFDRKKPASTFKISTSQNEASEDTKQGKKLSEKAQEEVDSK